MDIEKNDWLERKLLHDMYRRFPIAIQELRLKQVLSRNSKRHNDLVEQRLIREIIHLTLMLSSREDICQQLQKKQETINDLRSLVCSTEIGPAIVRSKYEYDEHLKRSKDATIEKKKAMMKHVKETSQQIPAVREIDAISKNIENSKAQLKAADKKAEKERVQIKIDKEKHQKDVNGLHKIIHNLNETIQIAEQELQQLENDCSSESADDSTVSSRKSLIENNVSKVHAKTSSKDEKEIPNAPNIGKQTGIGNESFKRAKDTSQSIPKVREIDAVSQNIGTLSLDQNELASKFNESNLIDDVDSDDEPPVENALNERCTPKTYSSKWKFSRIKPFIDNGDYPVDDIAKHRIIATTTIDSDSDSDL